MKYLVAVRGEKQNDLFEFKTMRARRIFMAEAARKCPGIEMAIAKDGKKKGVNRGA